MNELYILLAVVAGFLIGSSIVTLMLPSAKDVSLRFIAALKFHNAMSAGIIAFSGPNIHETPQEANPETGISSAPHHFLGISQEQYLRGKLRFSAFWGITLTLVFLIFGFPAIATIFLGFISIGIVYFLVEFIAIETIKQQSQEQVRQFPFFLDLYLLMVQSNGDILDTIRSYRSIFGMNEIARELVVFQEDYQAVGLLRAFERLRNRVGDENLRNILGELSQKLRTGTDLQTTLEQQAEDMRTLREELGAQAAERLNVKFNIPVVLATLSVLLIFLAPAVVQMVDSGFL